MLQVTDVYGCLQMMCMVLNLHFIVNMDIIQTAKINEIGI